MYKYSNPKIKIDFTFLNGYSNYASPHKCKLYKNTSPSGHIAMKCAHNLLFESNWMHLKFGARQLIIINCGEDPATRQSSESWHQITAVIQTTSHNQSQAVIWKLASDYRSLINFEESRLPAQLSVTCDFENCTFNTWWTIEETSKEHKSLKAIKTCIFLWLFTLIFVLPISKTYFDR